MFEEWCTRSFPDGIKNKDKEKINEFLLENSETEFSSNDIEFFLNLADKNFNIRLSCMSSFIASESRTLSLIRMCEGDLSTKIIRSIGCMFTYHATGERRKNSNKFLFQNFPIKFFSLYKKEEFNEMGVSIFHFLCCSHQREEFDDIKNLDLDFFPISTQSDFFLVTLLKELISQSNYHYSMLVLTRCVNINIFANNMIKSLHSKIKKIIDEKDIFLKLKNLRRISADFCKLYRGEFPSLKFKIKENYTHFVLKNIIISSIRTKS